ncbi:MAG TPA: hypothetical protein VMU16_13825 [Candidatus Binataceae bacterium]|nr:hypothetical protein [Candidatus Binataceae bacterium]
MKRNENIDSRKGLIRSLNRRGSSSDKSPPVAKKLAPPKEPTVCDRCGAVYTRKTWRQSHRITGDFLKAVNWGVCPACQQARDTEYYGRLILKGAGDIPANTLDAIRRRINNVAARASYTQPERRVVSVDAARGDIEVLTTSQKLAHRIAHEIVKAFGGSAKYTWSHDDRSLFATWRP